MLLGTKQAVVFGAVFALLSWLLRKKITIQLAIASLAILVYYHRSDYWSLRGVMMPKGFPLTEQDLDRVRHNIFKASVTLFLEKGFQETTMQEIARAAGMGKSTLYDYFPNKDEILLAYVEDVFFDLEQQARQISALEIPSLDKLRQVMHLHLEYLLANKELYIRLTFEVQRLGLEAQRRIQTKRHAYQDLLCRLIENAVQEGAFRPVNVLLAARTIIALLTPVAYTTRPTGTPDEMLDEALDIFHHGVIKPPEEEVNNTKN